MPASPESDIEVELKFRVDDVAGTRKEAEELGGKVASTIEQVDTYFAHPTRDFAQTDEALRVRLVGETGCVTYKGHLLDSETKSRQETEIWFAGGAADGRRFGTLLSNLGFREVREVRKTREAWHLTWEDQEVELVLDQVEGLGPFVELETMANSVSFAEAKLKLLSLAKRLNLRESERRSYLALLLAAE